MTPRGPLYLLAAALAVAPLSAGAYPGGTPDYQTDVAPFCAACHSSRDAAALRGAPGDRASKELAENKHLALIEAGAEKTGYAAMSPAEREQLLKHIRALDQASTIMLEAPERVKPGESFTVRVRTTGGGGPVVGIGLVDNDHRWFARPAASAGWRIGAPPRILGADANPQTKWLDKRPEAAGRRLSFVNVLDVRSDPATGVWSSAQVIFTLEAPRRPGRYPLAAVFLYGTEKASPFGRVTDALGNVHPRGGLTGGSGRVLFTPLRHIEVGEPPASR